MTTEGDGNYQLQRFLESEGAECDIQLVTAWLLYNIWEVRFDTRERARLSAGRTTAKYGLAGTRRVRRAQALAIGLWAADKALRAAFQTFAQRGGLYGYHLPDMDEVAEVASAYYNNDLRGGEGHMEVGKLILNVVKSKAHMTLSVKPFGCMPSSGVSDGVQSLITEKFPGHHLLRGRDQRRRRRQLLLARADVPVQGEAGGARRVRESARSDRAHGRAGARRTWRRTRSAATRCTTRRTARRRPPQTWCSRSRT